MMLWRPVGLEEMALVYEAGMARFPPRLPEQPIFYPVLNEAYAAQIARDWNAKQSPFAGYVLELEVVDAVAHHYPSQTVGAALHRELWVPADELPAFNRAIVSPIRVKQAFFGAQFRGQTPSRFGLRGADAVEQLRRLAGTMAHSMFDFGLELSANHTVVFLHFPFWLAAGHERLGVEAEVLSECLRRIRAIWGSAPRAAPLLEAAVVS